MFVPFRKETLLQPRFLRDEVRFNLFYRIAEEEQSVALQDEDGGVIALSNPGRAMWLWMDPERESSCVSAAALELAEALKGVSIPWVTAAPDVAGVFAEAYSATCCHSARLDTRLTAYSCPEVKLPSGVRGNAVRAGEEHVELVAQYRAGFNMDIFGTEEPHDKMLEAAARLIASGGLFLWSVEGKTVSMAAIAHRSPRHARINSVYTAPDDRNKGYAAALVATVSRMALDEGLTPMLYAAVDNPASNKAYRNIGYIPAGEIYEYGIID